LLRSNVFFRLVAQENIKLKEHLEEIKEKEKLEREQKKFVADVVDRREQFDIPQDMQLTNGKERKNLGLGLFNNKFK